MVLEAIFGAVERTWKSKTSRAVSIAPECCIVERLDCAPNGDGNIL